MTNKDKDFYNSKKSTQEESVYKDKLSNCIYSFYKLTNYLQKLIFQTSLTITEKQAL